MVKLDCVCGASISVSQDDARDELMRELALVDLRAFQRAHNSRQNPGHGLKFDRAALGMVAS